MRILIVDDEFSIRSSLEGFLKDEEYRAESCDSGERAVERCQEGFDVVFLDVVLPGMDGLETLKRIRKIAPQTKVFMMSGKANLSMAVQATKLGAYDFFEKPLHPERLLLALKNLAQQIALEQRVVSLESLVGWEEELVGNSPVMQHLKKAIAQAAPSEGRVLIYGENGTGKELVARAIHRMSARKNGPFVSLNCAALPQDLVESELFGYEKGAFTGAFRKKMGRFETAHGGTLFLDEVGDMALETQAKLLRVLEESETMRLGGEAPYRFDVRIISATNKNLKNEIEKNRFRQDLFYRLNVIPLEVVPLRNRKEDIPLLALHFLQRIGEKTGKGMRKWEPGVMDVLESYSWPGNVRELKNFIERLIIMCSGKTIRREEVTRMLSTDMEFSSKEKETFPEDESLSLRERVAQFEKEALTQGFYEVHGNVSELARRLKIDRANLHRKLKSYRIK